MKMSRVANTGTFTLMLCTVLDNKEINLETETDCGVTAGEREGEGGNRKQIKEDRQESEEELLLSLTLPLFLPSLLPLSLFFLSICNVHTLFYTLKLEASRHFQNNIHIKPNGKTQWRDHGCLWFTKTDYLNIIQAFILSAVFVIFLYRMRGFDWPTQCS